MNYVEEILEKQGSEEDKFYAIADIIAEKEAETSFTTLKVEEKNVHMIDLLLSEINNGGLDEYFFNTDGKYCQDTINVLKMLSQFELAEILNQASIIYFGDTNEEDKFDMLNEFDEKIYGQVDFEALYKACLHYLSSYRQKFN
ncbi:MAG: hypothetical protein K0R31_468 [Clostridiales bacterium]|jgi:hypothetical protein|nr:hypothetical protein [Clostridiales bacterium]MDF2890233.1 hypothetical protein [Clostridia bacterium]